MEDLRNSARFVPTIVLLLFTLSGATACQSQPPSDAAPRNQSKTPIKTQLTLPRTCPVGPAEESKGRRHLALIVGVGDYSKYPGSRRVKSLAGPSNDVDSLRRLLTDERGYDFPEKNVCVLKDGDATAENFELAFEEALIKRVKSDRDVVVVYRAGHGSQSKDSSEDEADGLDETFLFFNREYVDDEYNSLLGRLHADKTRNIVIIDDACHSGTPTRGRSSNEFIERFVEPGDKPLDTGFQRSSFVDRDKGVNAFLPGITVLSAAGDESTALERYAQGIFTTALVKTLESGESMTYAQLARRVPPQVKAQRSPQIPQFQGNLNRYVFDDNTRSTPLAWEVVETAPDFRLQGPPTPGMGVGAELRIYHGALSGDSLTDPEQQKALVRVSKYDAEAHTATVCLPVQSDNGVPVFKIGVCGSPVNTYDKEGRPIKKGDLAIMVRAADRYAKACVHIRSDGKKSALTTSQQEIVKEKISINSEAALYTDFDCGEGEYELSYVDGGLVLRDASKRVRNVFRHSTFESQVSELAKALTLHARQRVLLDLRGEGGKLFSDDQTLNVELVKSDKPSACTRPEETLIRNNSGEYLIPLCSKWQIKVSYSPDIKSDPDLPKLNVSALFMFANGNIAVSPSSGETIALEPGGKPRLFPAIVTATPPLDFPEYILVFGTQDGNRVNWGGLAGIVTFRGPGDKKAMGPLHRALSRAMLPGTRGGELDEYQSENETAWTMSRTETRVTANLGFQNITNENAIPVPREYTIPSFDIGPYIPDLAASPLRRVLKEASGLASEEVGYEQHDGRGFR